MNSNLNSAVWRQLSGALAMLGEAIERCPAELWQQPIWSDPEDRLEYTQFWFVAYHVLHWTDLFLNGSAEGFVAPDPFKRDESKIDGILPHQPYTKEELLTYLKHCRQKGRAIFETLSEEDTWRICHFPWMDLTYLELQLYCTRHIQEHAAQLNLLLGWHDQEVTDWILWGED